MSEIDEDAIKQQLAEAKVSSVDSAWPAQWVCVECSLRGLEGISLEINVFATLEDVSSIDTGDSSERGRIVRNVQGWPKNLDPWDNFRMPMAWSAWLKEKAFAIALDTYLNDQADSTA